MNQRRRKRSKKKSKVLVQCTMSCNIYCEQNKANSIQHHHHVLKVFDCGNLLIAVTVHKCLILITRNDNNFVQLREDVIDAAYSYPLFYIVTSEGLVFKTNIEQINTADQKWDEIVVDYKICKIRANGDGVLMTNENHELIGMGNFENVLRSDEPKIIDCFHNFKIIDVATGNNFALVLVQQKTQQDNINNINRSFMEQTRIVGKEVLKTQVWSFGSINKGLLGIGDHMKRNDKAIVVKLADIGVYQICCGKNHACALTIDGRLFLWGFNNYQQISLDTSVQDISAPTEYKSEKHGKVSQNVLAVACGSSNTVILLNDLTFRILGTQHFTQDQNDEFASNLKYEHDAGNIEDNELIINVPYIISHNKVLLVNRKNIPMFLLNYLADEQRVVRSLINAHQKHIKILQGHDEETRKLMETFENLMLIIIANLRMTFNLLLSDCEQQLECATVNVFFNEVMREYFRYLRQLCDIKSFYSFDYYEKRMDVKHVKIILEKPFACLEIYDKLLDLIYDLKLYNNPNALNDSEIKELKRQTVERKKTIEDFRKTTIPAKIKEAGDTFTFWSTLNDSSIKSELYCKERRFIMDSQQYPLKLHDRTNIFGSNRFILFNDYLVCGLARTEFIPIHLVWLQSFSLPNSTKFSFKIVTPENVLKVYSLTSSDKAEWQKNIRECTLKALRINQSIVNQSIPVSRYGSYKFYERNSKYPNYEVEGKWFDGKFYDLCHIKIPAINRLFKCRINNAGEMNGYGMIEDPSFSYHGEFFQGKLHGFGTWKSKSKTAMHYQGFFKQDKFHGFGVMSKDDEIFFGEYVNGIRNGFGVEDDAISGNKYIGMWQDGKKHGTAILITIDGTYFEGHFVNNVLLGNGLVIFPNGSYYIGELTMDGACGNGQFFLPDAEIIEEIMELDDSSLKMKGNVLKGVLAGSWDKISISNGNLLMNEIFLKIPNSSNILKIKSEQKWAVFFDNWMMNVFGISPERIGLHDRWHRVTSYINRKINFESDMRKNFILVNEDATSEDFNEMEAGYLNESMSLPTIGRSNSEIQLKDNSSGDFDTSSLRTFSDYSIVSLNNGSKKTLTVSSTFDFVPSFYNSTFTTDASVNELKDYLQKSIEDINHPFYILINELRRAFCTCYGSWRSKPTSILSTIAMSDWICLMKRIYGIFILLFPNLPSCDASRNDSDADGECKLSAPLNFMHQLLLNDEIYSCFFLLYASKNSRHDELYSQRLMTCEKKSNEELWQLLKIEPNLIPLLKDDMFKEAIGTFQKLSQKFCPSEMLLIIKETYEIISNCAKKLSSRGDLLSADNLLSITIYLIVKSGINHLGAELALCSDLMENDIEKLVNMEQYIYTTVKIGYLHTISTRFFHN